MRIFIASMRTLIALLLALAGPALAQQAYPSKPLRILLPFPPGSDSPSFVVRLLADKLTEALGQQVLVDNRPGGNGVIAAEALVKSAPDGYTFELVTSSHVVNPLVLPNLPYDTVKDFAPVATVVSTGYLLLLNPGVAANDLQQLIALAKSKPGQLNYGSSGPIQQLVSELFNISAAVKLEYVPYKGGAQAIADLMGGQIQVYFGPPAASISLVKSGKLKAVAISTAARLAALPQVPTFAEAGLPAYDAKNWMGVLAPAAMPRAIVERVSAEIAKMLAVAELKDRLAGIGLDPFVSNPGEFAALVKADMAKYARIVKSANIKLQN